MLTRSLRQPTNARSRRALAKAACALCGARTRQHSRRWSQPMGRPSVKCARSNATRAFQPLTSVVTRFTQPFSRAAQDSAAVKLERELLQLLLEGAQHTNLRARDIVEQLCKLGPTPQAKNIGSGRWIVRYFEGIAAWQAWGAAGNIVRGHNQAGQAYDVKSRRVENYAEIAGPGVHVRASGTFEVEDESTAQCRAYVTGGVLHWYGREVPLPFIRGSGTFRIRYLGRDLRIFDNPGSALSVQVRQKLLSASP